MKRTDTKSHCPVNFALESFGDPWSLLIVRDIASYNKHTYGEFLASKEGISSRMLAMCLDRLQTAEIIFKVPHAIDKRKEMYHLTPKGKALIPVLVELATWGSTFDSQTSAPETWLKAVNLDKSAKVVNQAKRIPFFTNGV